MTTTRAISPPISAILEEFFASYLPGASGVVRARIDAVRTDLETHLEVEGPRILTPAQRAILSTEKQFAPASAFVRTMHADDLYYALQHYLEPVHAMAGTELHTAQLDVVAALAASLWNQRLLSERNVSECTVIEFEIALTRARDLLKKASVA